MRQTVILLGKGKLLIRIAEWFRQSRDHELTGVVPVIPEPTWTDSVTQWCESRCVPHVTGGRYEDIPGVRDGDWHVDLALSVFYDRILPAWFIERAGRCLNLHNSPLPEYRGIAPINWALKNEEPRHGVTIHEVTPFVDAGPIVSQILYSIYPEFDEVIDVYNRAIEYGYCLFEQTIPILDRIVPRPQDESKATYYGRRDHERLEDRRDFTRGVSMLIS